MGLAFGVVIALLLMIAPGAIVGRVARLGWPVAVAVGPALTYGVVAVAIVPLGALGIPWNGWTALAALAVLTALAAALRWGLARYHDPEAGAARGPGVVVAVGVLLGAVLIGYAACRGMPHWQSIPSTWDSVWHANTVRFILDTGQASPTHMGELRNVETHDVLYYPSAFHALAAVLCQLTAYSPTAACTLSALAASVWLFPVSAAMLTWRMVRPMAAQWRTAGAAATAAALSASFTAVPYIEFDTGAMPNLTACGLAVPVFTLVSSTPAHRDRVPVAVLAVLGIVSVHLTGGAITVLLLASWWLLAGLRRPVRGRLADFATLAGVAAAAGLVLLPQFLVVVKQADIIAGHSFLSYLGTKRNVFDALFLHTRHLNDFPVQQMLIALAVIGALILVAKRVWWPLAAWGVLFAAIVHSSKPINGPVGAVLGRFSDLFYSDPRRLAAAVTLLLTPMAGIALCTLIALLVAGPARVRATAAGLAGGVLGAVVVTVHSVAPIRGPLKALAGGLRDVFDSVAPPVSAVLTVLLAPTAVAVAVASATAALLAAVWWLGEHGPPRTLSRVTAALLIVVTVALAGHYFPRHRFLMGDKYDSVMIDDFDLQAFACLASLPGARDTVIGNANTDGSAWMYAVADLHPLWTHYDYPVQQGPGFYRYVFWTHADDADTDPQVAAAVRALHIRYVLISSPIVRGFKLPEGLVSIDESASWTKIYGNPGVRIYEWHGHGTANCENNLMNGKASH